MNTVSEALKREVKETLGALRQYFPNKQELADALHVTRQAVTKWEEGTSYPTRPNWDAVQGLLREVRKAATKVTVEPPTTLSLESEKVLASPSLRAPHFGDRKERGMGAVSHVISNKHEKAYFLELDVCLWYHREEIDSGALSQTVIVAAREGALESSGCADWKAPQWWEELRSFDKRVRAQLEIHPSIRREEDKKN
jgi:transcriptional regulator with XRE-family HTH domain